MMPNNPTGQAEDVDINDVFEDILFSEEKVIDRAYQQGFEVGSSEDPIEGYHLGYHRGAEIGAELGFYQAFAEHHLNGNEKSKVLKSLETLKQGCEEYPKTNSESADFVELLEKLRGLYKKICAQLKVKTNFKKEGINF